MSDLPGFQPHTMTDDELLRRQEALESRLTALSRMGGAAEAITQLQTMLQLIEHARRERMIVMVAELRRQESPVVIETDPSLVVQPPTEQQPQVTRPMPARRPASVPIPRATPRPSRAPGAGDKT